MVARIWFCTASRSERGLVDPLLKRLGENPRFELNRVDIFPATFDDAYHQVRAEVFETGRPDLAFTPFDRVEMLGAAIGLATSNIPTAQIHAGDMSREGSWDDYVRHMITLCSKVQFCVSDASYLRALRLLETAGKPTQHCYRVRSIHFDDLEVDESLALNEPFDLVVYNPPTSRPDLINKELAEIEALIDKKTVWIIPNEDIGGDRILRWVNETPKKHLIYLTPTLPRGKYMGLLARCTRAIGNSSSFLLELPFFQKTYVHIGVRNTGREVVQSVERGGSDDIIRILEGLDYATLR